MEDKFRKVRAIDKNGNVKYLPAHLAESLAKSYDLTIQDLGKTEKAKEDENDLHSLTVAKLIELAVKNELPEEDYHGLKKAELIAYLEGKEIKA